MNSPSTSWTQVAIIATAGTVALAGGSYLAYRWWSSMEEDAAEAAQADLRMRMGRDLQMQALTAVKPPSKRKAGPKLPARAAKSATTGTEQQAGASAAAAAPLAGSSGTSPRQTPGTSHLTAGTSGSKAANSAAKPAGAASSRKMCAECGKPTSGLPLRCSGCKSAYYCSQDCQRKAWPTHRASCKAAGGSTPKGMPSGEHSQPQLLQPADSAGSQAAAPSSSGAPAPSTSLQPGQSEQSEQAPQSMSDALAAYLEEVSSSNSDELEAAFERAVMLFVKGDHRAALAQLHKVQALARDKGQTQVLGETYKWLGHAHNRLAEVAKAEAAFKEGAAFAQQHSQPRLHIDCLSGLGIMYRGQDRLDEAVVALEQALALAEAAQDTDSKAATLCNLGPALLQADPERALRCLHEALDLREQAVENIDTTDSSQRATLATAVMERATAQVQLASALNVTKRPLQAKLCYEGALEVFDLMQDTDKICKTLVNLCNLCELQLGGPAGYREAAEFRQKLQAFLRAQGLRQGEDTCAICLAKLNSEAQTKDTEGEIIMLSCMHPLHNACWVKWVEQQDAGEQGIKCPTCKQPVPVFAM